ncbi:MBL fold metallo-hydrolase [Reichenbachiella sp. MALMAid0571]|uniref:ComEC/Rec2 family competence protein n=1 Tax=Reichenbachiella sp. MALMAid0571 TaxID=3143939 RepID=UPI0032DE615A
MKHFIIVISILLILPLSDSMGKFNVGYDINKRSKPNKTNNLREFKSWETGYLDIHHINTGKGDACFMILPDGTTVIFDVGNMDSNEFLKKNSPLKVTSIIPNDSLSAPQWIARYIRHMLNGAINTSIDYALISHFHSDHFAGIVELGELIPIKKIIDRDYPKYDYPLDLKGHFIGNHSEAKKFREYLKFIDKNPVVAESIQVGKTSQIILKTNPEKYPTFKITSVKGNATIWNGTGTETFEYFSKEDMLQFYNGDYHENPLSLAIKLSYGKFDYFTGGDNTGLQGFGLPDWFDVETPMAKAVGKVEVMTLNHHGNRDATNEFFVNKLDPKVVVQQSWCSDHPGQEVYQRLAYNSGTMEDRDIFSTNMHQETLVTYGPFFGGKYKSTHGHIVIRVAPGGTNYMVYILDERSLSITSEFGPYLSE